MILYSIVAELEDAVVISFDQKYFQVEGDRLEIFAVRFEDGSYGLMIGNGVVPLTSETAELIAGKKYIYICVSVPFEESGTSYVREIARLKIDKEQAETLMKIREEIEAEKKLQEKKMRLYEKLKNKGLSDEEIEEIVREMEGHG